MEDISSRYQQFCWLKHRLAKVFCDNPSGRFYDIDIKILFPLRRYFFELDIQELYADLASTASFSCPVAAEASDPNIFAGLRPDYYIPSTVFLILLVLRLKMHCLPQLLVSALLSRPTPPPTALGAAVASVPA
jgi:hypothetical protein